MVLAASELAPSVIGNYRPASAAHMEGALESHR